MLTIRNNTFESNNYLNLRDSYFITNVKLIVRKIVDFVNLIFNFLLIFIKKAIDLSKRSIALKIYKAKEGSKFFNNFKLLNVGVVISIIAGILILKKNLENNPMSEVPVQPEAFSPMSEVPVQPEAFSPMSEVPVQPEVFSTILLNNPIECSIINRLLPDSIDNLVDKNSDNSIEGLEKILYKLNELEGHIRKDLKDKDLEYLLGIEKDELQIGSDFLALFQDDIKYVKDKINQLNLIEKIEKHLLLLKDVDLVEKDVDYLGGYFETLFKKVNSKKDQDYINFCIKDHLESIKNNLLCVF